MKKAILFLVFVSLFYLSSLAQNQRTYKIPPNEIQKLVLAPETPNISISPNNKWILLLNKPGFESIETLAQPELRIAGIRFNPNNYSQSRDKYSDSISIVNTVSGKEFTISGLPDQAKLRHFIWSPNSNYVAFTQTNYNGVELWLLDVTQRKARKITEAIVNNCLPIQPVKWIDHGEWMIFTAKPENEENPPTESKTTIGPIVRDTKGKKAAVRTYQDLLKNEYDANLFNFYSTSQLIKINKKKESYPVGIQSSLKDFSVSPDGRFILVKMIKKPYSFMVPYDRFPYKVEIWDTEGNLYRELFKIPSSESIPKGFNAVRKGPRNIAWRSDTPAMLYWVSALDGGDPNRKAITRDRLFLFNEPFDGEGFESIVFEKRFHSIKWGSNTLAISKEYWWKDRNVKISLFNPSEPSKDKETIFEYDWQDEYNYPGEFLTRKNENGYSVLSINEKGTELYLKAKGATPDGYKPFVDRYYLETKTSERMWQSINPYYEYPIGFIDLKKGSLLTKRESKSDAPNYFNRNTDNGVVKQITNFENPYPELLTVKTELLKYKRKDNIELSGKLYLPPGYSLGDGLLPVIIWAYPSEFKSAASASQVKSSPNRFIRIGWWSPLFWLTQGYAVLDNPGMPIIGEGDNEPNDTFTEQLVANAEAAIKCLDSVAIVDKDRIAIGGHSYGAFMAANLLAHSDLFAAGIARSGAYNRSLTPFGFQAEERTFWEARETYMNMSPFSFADKLNEPILLIHGEADNNSGTYPIQSERFFTALKGNGQTARLVILPYESHSYRSKESVLHMLWEMDRWLNKFVKNKADD